MQSIFCTLVWETLLRGRWILPSAFLGGNLVPILVLTALARQGISVSHQPDFIILHLVLSQVNMMCFAFGVFTSQGRVDRLFTSPISNRRLVAYHLMIGALMMIAEVALGTLLVNALFGADWPILGPALFGATALAVVYAAAWLADKSLWVCVGLTVLASLGSVWLRSRYGPFFSPPSHLWDDVSIGEFATLLAASVLSFGVGVIGVGRIRRGESPLSVGFIDWVARLLDPPLEVGDPFRSPAEAQIWYERRKKAGVIPIIVVFGLIAGFLFWLAFDRDPNVLFETLSHCGWFLIAVGMMGGLVYGSIGMSDSLPDMGPFRGTRPLTSKFMANTILKLAARDAVIGWLIWVGSVIAVFLILRSLQIGPHPSLDSSLFQWMIAGVSLLGPLVGCWIAVGVAATSLLAGRLNVFTRVVFLILFLWFGGLVLSSYLPPDVRRVLVQYVIAGVGIVCVATTIAVYVWARRTDLVSTTTTIGGLAGWAVLSGLIVAIMQSGAVVNLGISPSPDKVVAFIGLASLSAVPLAAAPLALARNRVR